MTNTIAVWGIPILIAAAALVIAIMDAFTNIRERIKRLRRK